MKRFLIRGILAIVAVIVLIAVAGFMLPEKHHVTRSIKLNSPADIVWSRIYNYATLPDWHPNVTEAIQLETKPGQAERWKIIYVDGNYMVLDNVLAEEKVLLSSHIVETSYPFSGDWIFELKPYGDGKTLLILTENGVIQNPFCRVFASLMGYEFSVEDFLNTLATSLNQPNTPIEF